MPLIEIPDFTATQKPAPDDVRTAEQAIVEVIGGIHEGVRYPGDLDAANIAAAAGFTNEQKRECRARIMLGTAARWKVNPGIYWEAPSLAVVIVPSRIECDTVQFWHNDPSPLTGKIEVYRDGVLLTEFALPPSVAQGVIAEFPFRYLLDPCVLEFRGVNGTNLLKKASDGTAPAAYVHLDVSILGSALHVA